MIKSVFCNNTKKLKLVTISLQLGVDCNNTKKLKLILDSQNLSEIAVTTQRN